MALIITIAIGILTLIAVFSVVPVVGGSIDNSMPDLSTTDTVTLTKSSASPLSHGGIANVIVSNQSDLSPALVETTDYTVDASTGTITLLASSTYANGTYYVNYDWSQWSDANTDLPASADIWTQLGLLLILAVLALVIGLVIMYFRNAAQ